MSFQQPRTKSFATQRISDTDVQRTEDKVAVEEPMEIRLVFGPANQRVMRPVSVTMRTPGSDRELAAGFLFTEGIVTSPDQIESIEIRGVDDIGQPTGNLIRVSLHPDVDVDLQRLQRNFLSNSSCGVCGKASLSSLEIKGIAPLELGSHQLDSDTIRQLPDRLRTSQPAFDETGGIHAAGFSDQTGKVIEVWEDVGRHNAVDKLIGSAFRNSRLPASKNTMIVSGRASFEIVQKAIVAGVPVMVAVGAPSSLAVELAEKFRMTLIGFASRSRFNVYTCSERIDLS